MPAKRSDLDRLVLELATAVSKILKLEEARDNYQLGNQLIAEALTKDLGIIKRPLDSDCKA